MYVEHPLFLSAEEGEDAVRGCAQGILLPVEPRLVFPSLLFFVLSNLGAEHGTAAEEIAHFVACLHVLAHPLGYDVACAGQRLVGRLHALLRVDKLLGQLFQIAGVLFLQLVGEGFQPTFDGHGGAGAAFGLIGEVQVFQLRHSGSCLNLLLQLGRQLALLLNGGQDGLAAFVNLFQLQKQVADGGNLYFVKAPRHLFAVAGYKGYCGTLFQQLDGLLHLTWTQVQLFGDDSGVVHGKEGFKKKRARFVGGLS